MEFLNNLKENLSEDPLFYVLMLIILILIGILLYFSIIYIKQKFQKNDNSKNQIKRSLIKKNLNMKEPSNIKREKEVFNISNKDDIIKLI